MTFFVARLITELVCCIDENVPLYFWRKLPKLNYPYLKLSQIESLRRVAFRTLAMRKMLISMRQCQINLFTLAIYPCSYQHICLYIFQVRILWISCGEILILRLVSLPPIKILFYIVVKFPQIVEQNHSALSK